MGKGRRSSLAELVKGRLREFRREPSAFFFVLLMPILYMVLLGPAFSGSKVDVVGVGWPRGADVEESDLSRTVHEALARSKAVRLHEGTSEELTTLLRRGDALVIVEVTPTSAMYFYDADNRDSRRARAIVNEVVQQAAGRTEKVLTLDEQVDIPGTRYIDFLVPGILALSILSTSIFGTGMTLVSNRRENLLKRLLATPMRPYEYILSHILGRGVILGVEVVTQLVAAAVIFQFHVAGRLVEFLAVAGLGAAAVTALGIMLGARSSNTAAMNGICNLVTLPMMLLSGAFFPRSAFPDWLAEATRYLPLTPLVDGLRRIALEGAGLADLTFELALLAGYFVVCSAVALVTFKWH